MAYSSWSVVFNEQPSASKWNILGTNDASFNDGTGIGNDAITDTKLVYGKIRSRQGGSATNWGTAGTTTFDYSATNTFIQVGSKAIAATPTTITFPTAFNQVPLVLVTTATAVANTVWMRLTATTATTATVIATDASGVNQTTETAFWIAVGE